MNGDVTHFERLGLPRRFPLDPAELERNYLARSRAVHPDHAGNLPANLESAAAVNEAYAVLRDPFRRADYLLLLAGGPSAAEQKQAAPEFLEEMLELRMRIEEVKRSADPDRADRGNLDIQLSNRRDALLTQVGGLFDKLETLAPAEESHKNECVEIRQALNATKYLNGLLRDLADD